MTATRLGRDGGFLYNDAMQEKYRSAWLSALLATFAFAALTVSPALSSDQQDLPRLKLKTEEAAPSQDLLPRVPLNNYSAGFETTDPLVKSRGISSPTGMQSLDAHKQEPIAPFVGLSLKRPLN
jgi:hypothetical protein